MNAVSRHAGAVRRDLQAFCVMATVSLCAGLLLNQFRDEPLPLVYQSKQARLEQAVARLGSGKDGVDGGGRRVGVGGKPWIAAMAGQVVDGESNRGGAAARAISLDEFRDFVEHKKGVVLDVRPEIFHRLGHVPGALSLPREDFEKSYARLKDKLEAGKNQVIVVYCSGGSCEDSGLVRNALVSLGYSRVAVFAGGWAEWEGGRR